jgi:hypothetical protein
MGKMTKSCASALQKTDHEKEGENIKKNSLLINPENKDDPEKKKEVTTANDIVEEGIDFIGTVAEVVESLTSILE